MSCNKNRNPLLVNDSPAPVIDSVLVSPATVPNMMEDPEMLQRDGETSASARYLPLMDDEHYFVLFLTTLFIIPRVNNVQQQGTVIIRTRYYWRPSKCLY